MKIAYPLDRKISNILNCKTLTKSQTIFIKCISISISENLKLLFIKKKNYIKQ